MLCRECTDNGSYAQNDTFALNSDLTDSEVNTASHNASNVPLNNLCPSSNSLTVNWKLLSWGSVEFGIR